MKQKLIYLMTCLVLLSASFFIYGFKSKKEDSADLVFVRTIEAYSSMLTYTSGMYIVYSDGKTETVELEVLKDKTMQVNMTKVMNRLNKLNSEGYRLKSTNGASIVEGVWCTNYVFERID